MATTSMMTIPHHPVAPQAMLPQGPSAMTSPAGAAFRGSCRVAAALAGSALERAPALVRISAAAIRPIQTTAKGGDFLLQTLRAAATRTYLLALIGGTCPLIPAAIATTATPIPTAVPAVGGVGEVETAAITFILAGRVAAASTIRW